MESETFDQLTARLTPHLTRRRGLGLLAALGAATLANGAEAGKHKKKKHKKKPCGGTCGACEGCFNGVCTQVADGVACTGGTCLAGECRVCPSGKVLADGLCAKICAANAECGGAACLRLAGDNDSQDGGDMRRVCVVVDSSGPEAMPPCPSGRSTECGTSRLCVDYASGLVCAFPV